MFTVMDEDGTTEAVEGAAVILCSSCFQPDCVEDPVCIYYICIYYICIYYICIYYICILYMYIIYVYIIYVYYICILYMYISKQTFV